MSQYYYAENGVQKGPVSAQHLQELARAGRVQPQTLVWAEGFPNWVPAASVQGLLPRPPAPPGSPPPYHFGPDAPAPAASTARLLIVAGIFVGVLAVLVVVIVLLVNAGGGPSPAPNPAGPPSHVEGERKKEIKPEDPPPEPPPDARPPEPQPKTQAAPVAEMTAPQLLEKYRKDGDGTVKELGNKRITLKIEAVWRVEDLKKSIDALGNLNLYFYTSNNREEAEPVMTPDRVIFLNFPNVNPKSKLGFFARIKEYAEKWKKGEKVAISITGTLTTLDRDGKRFLYVQNAELNRAG